MAAFYHDSVEHRKNVWRAAREHYKQFGQAFDLTNLQVKVSKPGLVVFADMRPAYCDGRTLPQVIDRFDGREVLYIELVEPSE